MLKIRNTLLSLLFFMTMCSVLQAAEFYVDGANGNDSNPGTLSNPWKTLSKANNSLMAGDTVYIRSGDYSGQQIYPSNSGSADNRIVYQNYNNEVVRIINVSNPLQLSNRSYITINGLTFNDTDTYLLIENGNHNYIEYCIFDDPRNVKTWRAFWISTNSKYNWIHHCTISRFGWQSDGEDYADMIFIGSTKSPWGTNYNLIENNHMYYGGHNVIRVTDSYNVIRNNYFHHEEWYPENNPTYGNRIGEVSAGTSQEVGEGGWNLFEGNRFCFTGDPIDGNYAPALQVESSNNIWRGNMFYNLYGPAIQINTLQAFPTGVADNNYIFHNVFYHLGLGQSGRNTNAITLCGWNGGIKGTVVKNNIFHENVGGIVGFTGPINLSDNTFLNNWQTADGDPKFIDANTSLLNPNKHDYPNFNLLNLQVKSPCIDSGTFLTRTISSGSGREIQVNDAHYFIDGWGIIEGDIIQFENQSESARIISVDYTNNIISIDRSLTWSNNQGVSLKFNGLAPDIGPFESSISNSIVILAPENLSIVRR